MKEEQLDQHMKIHNGQKDEDAQSTKKFHETNHKCSQCSKHFSNINGLKMHERVHVKITWGDYKQSFDKKSQQQRDHMSSVSQVTNEGNDKILAGVYILH